jgi:hypothetical protein
MRQQRWTRWRHNENTALVQAAIGVNCARGRSA